MNKDNIYDVLIVGAGIGGLVCGCYLAKHGKKVLIFEKNDHPGGCCTSFVKNGFHFDAAAHSLGGMSQEGPIGSVLRELEIDDAGLYRTNPAYILQIDGYKLNIWNNFSETIDVLIKDFKDEKKAIEDFFKFILSATTLSLIKLKKLSFEQFLNQYFFNEKLKAVLFSPLLGNTGVEPLKISTFTALKFYQQYILDGGYHLRGGMQALPDLLMKKFCELGGQVRLLTEVNKILIKHNTAVGVKAKEEIYNAQVIVSNIDSRRTFLGLIERRILGSKAVDLLNSLRPSSSLYACYIGLKGSVICDLKPEITHWFVSDYDIKKIYQNVHDCKLTFDWLAVRLSKDRKNLQVFTIAPLMDETYWRNNDIHWKEGLRKRIATIIPNFSDFVDLFLTANPITIMRWTANYGGATCGWESTPDQFSVSGISQRTMVANLYLTGHWTTTTLGIPGVVNVGKSTAQMILA